MASNANRFLDDLAESISVMELKFRSMKNEISQLKEKRSSMGFCPSSTDISDSLTLLHLDGNAEKRIEILEENNKNLADELIEYKDAFSEKANECELNREKYLKAEQLSEEYYRQLNAFNLTKTKLNEENSSSKPNNEDLEYGRLTFILETNQLELKETQTNLKIAERTIAALSDDLQACIIKCESYHKELEIENTKYMGAKEEAIYWKSKFDELENKNKILEKSVEKIQFYEDCLESKTRDYYELNQQIDKIREENSKHVSRIKERTAIQKRAFQSQISGLEMELVQLRENLNSAYKNRDEIKYRMQNEIINLEQKFSDSQLEIKNLKSHVNILKTSYANMLEDMHFIEDDDDDDADKKHENDFQFEENYFNNIETSREKYVDNLTGRYSISTTTTGEYDKQEDECKVEKQEGEEHSI